MRTKLLNSMRTLLVAALLGVGANAWSQTTVLSQNFTTDEDGGTSTDPTKYGFTNTGSVDATVTDGKFSSVVNTQICTYTAALSETVGDGKIVTFTCTWSPGAATGGGYSYIGLTDAYGKFILKLQKGNNDTKKNYEFFVNDIKIKDLNSGNNNDIYNVSATIDMNKKMITSLTVGSIHSISSPIDFASSDATSISKLSFGHRSRNNYGNTATLDDIVVSYQTTNYKLNAVKPNGELITTLESGINDFTETPTITSYFSKFINVNGTWYECSAPYTKTFTEEGTQTVTFTESDITYFYEVENLTANRGNQVTDAGDNYSGHTAQRHYGASGRTSYYYTPALAGGKYTVQINVAKMANTSATPLSLRYRTSSGTMSEAIVSESFSTAKTYTYENFVIPEGCSFVIYSGNEYNSNALMDYITLKRTGDATVSNTITAAGWATYCSPYILDFSSEIENLDAAYIVTGGADGVLSKQAVDGAVPAGTGLLLKGSGTVAIPVAAAATFDTTANKLEGKTASFALAAEGGYVLMNDATNGLGFYLNANEFTVGANTAYLPSGFDGSGARMAFFWLGDDTTGINAAQTAESSTKSYYNLNGQRVNQPTKGLYIVNGKKVIIK